MMRNVAGSQEKPQSGLRTTTFGLAVDFSASGAAGGSEVGAEELSVGPTTELSRVRMIEPCLHVSSNRATIERSVNELAGSQVSSSGPNPFHRTRYRASPSIILSTIDSYWNMDMTGGPSLQASATAMHTPSSDLRPSLQASATATHTPGSDRHGLGIGLVWSPAGTCTYVQYTEETTVSRTHILRAPRSMLNLTATQAETSEAEPTSNTAHLTRMAHTGIRRRPVPPGLKSVHMASTQSTSTVHSRSDY
jgi:hypothetical protein